MSLFQEIRRLSTVERDQLEDVLTEIVAAVLRRSPELALSWLKGIGATELESVDAMRVTTQERFEQLDGHDSESRIDLVIRLEGGGRKQIVFIESKVGSEQGEGQLRRYAEHLAEAARRSPKTAATLVFITRDYEQCEKPAVNGFSYTFCRARWFEFFRYLKPHSNSDGLAEQLKLFLEENRMSIGNQFRSTDLVALENFLGAKALMDETLTAASEHAKFGLAKFSNIARAMTQLRMHQRYIRHIDYEGLHVFIGYWLPSQNPDEQIWLGVMLQSDPGSPNRRRIIEAFKS